MKSSIIGILVIGLIAAVVLHHQPNVPLVTLTQDAYIWQHDWSGDVATAATKQRHLFQHYVVLVAEITPRSAPPGIVLIHPDYAVLAKYTKEIGLAIRVGKMTGSAGYEIDSPQTKTLLQTAGDAVTQAQAAGLSVCELQVDYDCAQSKLGLYRNWIALLKKWLSVPIVITALPSWLKESSFSDLAQEAGSFVMQVHSLHQPTSLSSTAEIFDAAEAQAAVDQSAKLNLPFRVALPTYSYLAAFNTEGKFVGLSGEGRLPDWSAAMQLRTLRSEPAAIAPLVKKWLMHPPENLTGIIWYRLPVQHDALNWSAVTLQAVMSGQTPKPHLVAETEKSDTGSVEIFLKNTGDADSFSFPSIQVQASNPIEIAEPLSGFVRLDGPRGTVIFENSSAVQRRIAPAERIQLGWVRVDKDTEVHAHVVSP